MVHRLPPKTAAELYPEDAQTELVLPLLEKNDVVIDAGARFGAFAIQASSLVKKILAFEPNPYSFKYMNKFISGINNIDTYEYALYNIKAGRQLNLTHNSFTTDGSIPKITATNRKVNYIRSISINTIRLDDFTFKQTDKIVVVADVEGSEVELIEGAHTTLKQIRIFAYEASILESGQNTKEIVDDILVKRYGFKILVGKEYFDAGGKTVWTVLVK